MPAMPAAAARAVEESYSFPWRQSAAYTTDPDVQSLMRGYSDYKAGRMRPWSEVKAELGIR